MENEDLLERIEAYMNGTLNPQEKVRFEKELEADEALRQAYEQQKLIAETVRLSSLRQERERLRAIHEAAMSQEDILPLDTDLPGERAKVRRLLSWAAILLIGVLIGTVINRFISGGAKDELPIARDGTEDDSNYGGVSDGIPLFEAMVPLIRLNGSAGELEVAESSLSLSIFSDEGVKKEYELTGQTLNIFLPIAMIDASRSTSLIIQRFEQPALRQLILKMDEKLIQILITDEDFERLWKG